MGRLIKQINYPADLRKFKKDDLKQISDELRDELIDIVSETGGHLGAGLGVVELTVALHYVFDTPTFQSVASLRGFANVSFHGLTAYWAVQVQPFSLASRP